MRRATSEPTASTRSSSSTRVPARFDRRTSSPPRTRLHELSEDDLELVGLVPERLDARLEARHVAMVVGAPDVDEQVEAAVVLVPVVGDVGQEVGGLPVRLHEDAVLVVAEVRRAQPGGTVLLEHHPAVPEIVEGGADLAGVGQRLLARPRVEHGPDAGQALPQIALGPLVAPLRRVDVVGHLRRPLADVLARVAVLGQLRARLPRRQRGAEDAHLHAAVVEVVLPVDDVTGALEDPAQRVAEGGPAPPARVDRPGGVGRHELDVDPPATPEVEARVAVLAAGDHVDEDVVEPRLPKVEVHEPGSGDLNALDVVRRRGVQPLDEVAGQLAWHSTVGLGRRHGHVGGPVAVLPPTGPLEVDLRRRLDARVGQGGAQGGGEGVSDHGRRMLRGPLFRSPDRSGGREANTLVSEGPRGGSVGSC